MTSANKNNEKKNEKVENYLVQAPLTLIDKHIPKDKKLCKNFQKKYNKSHLQLSTQCETDNLQ